MGYRVQIRVFGKDRAGHVVDKCESHQRNAGKDAPRARNIKKVDDEGTKNDALGHDAKINGRYTCTAS